MLPRIRKQFSARSLAAFEAGPVAVGGLSFKAATGADPAEILIYDVIGGGMWDDGVTAKQVIAALAEAGTDPVRVRINSPGGDVFEGLAIYNALRNYTGGVETVVDGLAASAASIIALGGSSVVMNSASMFMIHNAATIAFGDRNDMAQVVAVLAKVDAQLATIYSSKTGTDQAEIAAMMDAESWFSADEALAAKLIDSVLAPPKAKPDPAPDALAEPTIRAHDRNRWMRYMESATSN
jgi:ATP-dependent Clp endopeptidase proteolytic subunit ClpP